MDDDARRGRSEFASFFSSFFSDCPFAFGDVDAHVGDSSPSSIARLTFSATSGVAVNVPGFPSRSSLAVIVQYPSGREMSLTTTSSG